MPEPAFKLTWRGDLARYFVSKPNIGNTDVFTADQVREVIHAATERAAKQVPTSWLDPMLTGPDAVPGIDKVDTRTVEALLHRIAAAIRARDGGGQG